MITKAEVLAVQTENYEFFNQLPELERIDIKRIDARSSQLLQPLFEYSGACSGCGETSYIKLLTQLFGDRMLIANATGCSSIYGGNLPTTPYTTDGHGRDLHGQTLFENNAEFGLGMRLAVNSRRDHALYLLEQAKDMLPTDLVDALQTNAMLGDENSVVRQREHIADLRSRLDYSHQALIECADDLVAKSTWIVGGDGWAYDIGFGGLEHVLATNNNVNVLVMGTQGYSNTGGQQSKATPTGAVAKFATNGKSANSKDIAINIMMLGNVYVAKIALGANMNQSLKAIQEAEAYPGSFFSNCLLTLYYSWL